MNFARRFCALIRERVSLALGGSLLWWVVEHLVDKAIGHAMEVFSLHF